MEFNENTAELISRIEYLIGDNCYNPSSYDGYTGQWGSGFRYPVQYADDEGNRYKTKDFLPGKEIAVKTAMYKFGANELHIGKAIVDVLAYLEKRYMLDFYELEVEYQNKLEKEKKEKEKDEQLYELIRKELIKRKHKIEYSLNELIATTKNGQSMVFHVCRRGNVVGIKELKGLYYDMDTPNNVYEVPAKGYFISEIPYASEAIEYANQNGIVLFNTIGEIVK